MHSQTKRTLSNWIIKQVKSSILFKIFMFFNPINRDLIAMQSATGAKLLYINCFLNRVKKGEGGELAKNRLYCQVIEKNPKWNSTEKNLRRRITLW